MIVTVVVILQNPIDSLMVGRAMSTSPRPRPQVEGRRNHPVFVCLHESSGEKHGDDNPVGLAGSCQWTERRPLLAILLASSWMSASL